MRRLRPPIDGGVANTNIIFHAGRLLALEEGHLPTEIEPGTLKTRGYCDYNAGISGPFTAHPKIDPVTGEMVFFGYNAAGPLTPALSFGSVNASGVVTRFERFDAPYASMVHDFIVTENHLLFPVLPLAGSMERVMRGGQPYAWEPDKGGYVGVMKRHGAARRYRLVSRRELLRVSRHECVGGRRPHHRRRDAVRANRRCSAIPTAGRPTRNKTRARLCRWTFDLAANTDRFTQTWLDDIAGEFPRVCDNRVGSPNRHGWYSCGNPDQPAAGALAGVMHVDGNGSRLGQYLLPPGDTLSEPAFVARGDDAAEGDGWLLSVVWRGRENRSDLAVFNATDVASGPVALVELGHRVPDGIHGNWVGAA